MLERRKIKVMFAVVFLALLVFIITAAYGMQQRYCMDVPLIEKEKLKNYQEEDSFDSFGFVFNGENAAFDKEKRTIYISQSMDKLSHSSLLEGSLKHRNPEYELYFLKDKALEDIATAVQKGNPLTLILIKEDSYQKIPVIISTLPVMNLEGEITGMDEDSRDILTGKMTLWTGADPQSESYSTKSSDLEWHIRGNTTAKMDKTPWKLSLKDKNGENKNMEFLNMGLDDDWILNSLTIDNTKIREKLFMDLWNLNVKTADYNFKMSTGEFIELVLNGEYYGIYLLQRRLDAKYLELEEEDVLLKGTIYQVHSPQEAYEIVTPTEHTEEIYAAMQPVFDRTDCSVYNVHNLIDTNLFLQFSSARDNFGYKNIYHLLKKTEEGYEHFLIPWDTDMTFGIDWQTGRAYCYDYETCMDAIEFRLETKAVKTANANYDVYAAKRWEELRQTIFKEEMILAHIDKLYESITESGSISREIALWGEFYDGEDNISNLKKFVSERLLKMDAYYKSQE